MIIELFVTLTETDRYTSFFKELLEGTADLSQLKILDIVKKYLKKMKHNKELIGRKIEK